MGGTVLHHKSAPCSLQSIGEDKKLEMKLYGIGEPQSRRPLVYIVMFRFFVIDRYEGLEQTKKKGKVCNRKRRRWPMCVYRWYERPERVHEPLFPST